MSDQDEKTPFPSDRSILVEMLRGDSLLPTERAGENQTVSLVEDNNAPSDGGGSFVIRDIPQDTIVFKSDRSNLPAGLFNCKNGECKRADFVIICEESKWMVFVEMKSKHKKRKAVLEQLKGSQCLMVYCREIGKTFWGKKNFLNGYNSRFALIRKEEEDLIANRHYRREASRPRELNDNPEKYLEIVNSSIRFRTLVKGGKRR